MKGNMNTIMVTIVSVVMLLFIITSIFSIFSTVSAKESLYDKMANPLVWGAKEVVKYGSEKFIKTCENLLLEVESIFSYEEVERECSRWYLSCTKDLENAPQNPWTKLKVSEEDLETVNYLAKECKTSGIDKLRKRWIEENSYFANKNELEQYNLIKNACGSILVKRIYG